MDCKHLHLVLRVLRCTGTCRQPRQPLHHTPHTSAIEPFYGVA
ncbi:predicted protein [Botrytis cinerea T4]|uniref:Uncharacterized protein n=1 Tax=Botryotinia fuckeliana (strain T4) TaxID=999810 RepID=G2Y608_BOTF4|nr:predicted protein [Botrytis cinerea T4]